MTTAGDIMHEGAECIGEYETLAVAARRMRDQGVGALPICGPGNEILGIVTDRDIVVRCVADGRDPLQTPVADLIRGTAVTVDVNSDIDDVLSRMVRHGIRRVPVLDHDKIVGMISEADLARSLPEEKVGGFIEAITSLPG